VIYSIIIIPIILRFCVCRARDSAVVPIFYIVSVMETTLLLPCYSCTYIYLGMVRVLWHSRNGDIVRLLYFVSFFFWPWLFLNTYNYIRFLCIVTFVTFYNMGINYHTLNTHYTIDYWPTKNVHTRHFSTTSKLLFIFIMTLAGQFDSHAQHERAAQIGILDL